MGFFTYPALARPALDTAAILSRGTPHPARGSARGFPRSVAPAAAQGAAVEDIWAAAREGLREAREAAERRPGGRRYARAIGQAERALARLADQDQVRENDASMRQETRG